MSTVKRKRLSKKNKSTWRKTDIQDVEEFLEAQRQDERIGSVTEKPDEELFVVDTVGGKHAKSGDGLSAKEKRIQNAINKPLRHLQALENKSQVQDPIAKRNIVKLKKNGRNIEEEVRNPTKARHVASNAARQEYYQTLKQRELVHKQLSAPVIADPWAEDESVEDPRLKGRDRAWVGPELALHITSSIGQKPVKVHDSLRHKTTKSSKFIAPHPGLSANPSPADHRQLIDLVVAREEGVIKEEQHLKRVTSQMFSKLTPAERDARYFAEMSADIADPAVEEAAAEKPIPQAEVFTNRSGNWLCEPVGMENSGANSDRISVNPPVEDKKKNRKARRKEREQKQVRHELSVKKYIKKQVTDLHRIKHLNIEVEADLQQLKEAQKRRRKTAEQKKYEPKRLSRTKFVEPDVNFNMPDEIPGNLRNVENKVNLLADVFHNLQRRNVLPASVAVSKPKNRKVKRFARQSHKEAPVTFQMLRDKRRAEARAAAASAKATIQFDSKK